jgi:hypothetical protein
MLAAVAFEERRLHRIVLGGTKLYVVNETLAGQTTPWLTVPTLGGSHGQSIAGAVSTCTHGSDFEYSSLVDMVQAIHLVGPGGQEFWIEGSAARTTDDSLRQYPAWDDDIEVIRDDEVFSSALVAAGRFGIIYSYLVRLEEGFNLDLDRRTEAWLDRSSVEGVRSKLLRVAATGDFSELTAGVGPDRRSVIPDDPWGVERPQGNNEWDRRPRFVKLDMDPYGLGGHSSGLCAVTTHWKTLYRPILDAQDVSRVGGNPAPLPMTRPGSAGGLAYEIHTAITLANIFGWMSLEAYAEFARGIFAGKVPPARHRDRNHYVSAGYPAAGTPDGIAGWRQTYRDFDDLGPFVLSTELAFDASSSRFVEFVEQAYAHWRGPLGRRMGGYFTLRFSQRRSPAKLGLQRWARTVIMEITSIQGFPDAQQGFTSLLELARQWGAVHHWGQDSLLEQVEIQAQFGADITAWRRVLRHLSRRGRLATFSNAFSRRLGLEYGPGLMIARAGRIVAWIGHDRNEARTAWGFPASPASPGPGTLSIRRTGGAPIRIAPDGSAHAAVARLPLSVSPGQLVIRREGEIMAVLDGNATLMIPPARPLPEWI